MLAFFVDAGGVSTRQDAAKISCAGSMSRRLRLAGPSIRFSPASSRSTASPTRPALKNADTNHRPEDSSATPSPDDQEPRTATSAPAWMSDGAFALAVGVAAPSDAGHAGNRRDLEAGHDRGNQAGPQHRAGRPERQLDVSGRLQGTLRAHPAAGAAAVGATQGVAVPRHDLRPHRGDQAGRSAWLWAWELSADRANSIRKILEEEGMPTASVFMVAGRADTQPLFPDDPFVAANRRVTITLMSEASPLPANLKP